MHAPGRGVSENARFVPPRSNGARAGPGEGAAGVEPRRSDEQQDLDDGMTHKDAEEQTFTEYEPHTFSSPIFQRHPDPVVETASLSALVPPKSTYRLCICSKTIAQARLTNLQLETISLACQQHELRMSHSGVRAGFFMGDGPGIGKGRQAAGIILENYLRGRKRAVWLSISADLVDDARRDISDIGGSRVKCHNLKDFAAHQPLEKQGVTEGILFCTYSILISERSGAGKVEKMRLQQVVEWCGAAAGAGEFNGVVILDECHRAKNMGSEGGGRQGAGRGGRRRGRKEAADDDDDEEDYFSLRKSAATKTATFVDCLQQQLPLARVVYLSATGASDPRHFLNLSRLGLWGPGTAFEDQVNFIEEMHKGGIGAMELVAMHMKASGQYLSRSLSFKEASFEIVEVTLSAEFKSTYDSAVAIWQRLIALPDGDWARAGEVGGKRRNMKGLLWAAHLRFFSQMITAAKIPEVTAIVEKALAEGMCCVIGLQSTGEAAGGEAAGGAEPESELFSNAANGMLRLVEEYYHPQGEDVKEDKEALLEEIRRLALPPNPLDDLIDKLGGVRKVAEMTGRSVRWVKSRRSGRETWALKRRVRDDSGELTVNIGERKKFQSGRKLVAIISEAASSGISLQADRCCANQRRRVHITLQLPWASDQIVQQMGRTHRSNQSSAPVFKLVMTPIGGEWRFASAVARRLQALGALTQV